MNTSSLGAVALHRRTTDAMDQQVRRLRPEDWTAATPCAGWDVRTVVNHVVAENRWTGPLLAGQTTAEVGHALDGDLLGADPVQAWQDALTAARAAAAAPGVEQCVVHLSFGDVTGAEYLRQLAADHLVHAWDVARAVGDHDRLDPELVTVVAAWFLDQESAYRRAGAIGPRPPATDPKDPQAQLLAMFGRSAVPGTAVTAREINTMAAVDRFSAAFDRQDLDAVMAAMTSDCVFESTSPPDGERHAGQAAVRTAWATFFAGSPDAVFETEDSFACGDRALVRWLFRWDNGHVRGTDVFRVRDGLVAEKLSYVKG